jgi:hypothetical protein
MALKFRKKDSSQPQQQAPAPAPAPAPANWSLPSDWREQLTAAKPKGRFTQGENVRGGYR